MTRKTILTVVGLMAAVGLTLGLATTALASPRAAAVATYTITATAGANGTINPIGDQTVASGGSAVYTMEPAEGYQVATITVDASSVPKACWYTFLNVTAPHTISVSFQPNPVGWYTVTPHAGPHGQIWMAAQTVQASDTVPAIVACSITSDAGYHVATLVVDGLPVAPTTYYIFYNVRAGHTISATFAADPVVPADTLAPVSSSNAVANYDGPAVIGLTASDEDGGSGIATLSWRLDGGATQTVSAAGIKAAVAAPPITPTVPAPSGHFQSGTANTNTGCALCHTVAAAPDIAASAVAPAVHSSLACNTCHTILAPQPTGNTLTATITVNTEGAHTLEFWASDKAGNVEQHHTANFTVTLTHPAVPCTCTIAAAPGSCALGKTFVLSGCLEPGEAGDTCVVWVKKPGSGRWSYSSARISFGTTATGGSNWWYRYLPKVRGVFSFKTSYAGDAQHLATMSKVITVKVK